MKAYFTGQGVWLASMTRNGKRITFYLGKRIDHREASRQAKILTCLVDVPSQKWATDHRRDYMSLPERVRGSLQRHFEFCRLTDLECLFERHLLTKSHIKKSSRSKYCDWYKRLGRFFGERLPSSLTFEDAERFKFWCSSGGLSEATVSRGMRICRSIFKFGLESGLLLHNPFSKLKGGKEENSELMYYVDRGKFSRLLLFCCDDRERLILALARYGGLRIPSEIRNLRFCDISDTLIRVSKDTKTGAREVPLFSEIKEIFCRLEGVVDPAGLVLGNISKDSCRRLLKRVILAAGFEPWPKLFVNLRSSCITDFVMMGYSEKALDSMFGNSTRVRELHYVQFRKESEYRRMLEENRRLSEYLRYRISEDSESFFEPWELREFVIAQRIANRPDFR